MSVVQALGGKGSQYRRERNKAIRAVVSEIYSRPRVTAAAKLLPELRLIPGVELDPSTADINGALWDFDCGVMRERAMKKLKGEKPMLRVGSRMCAAFPNRQRNNNLIRSPATVANEKKEQWSTSSFL